MLDDETIREVFDTTKRLMRAMVEDTEVYVLKAQIFARMVGALEDVGFDRKEAIKITTTMDLTVKLG